MCLNASSLVLGPPCQENQLNKFQMPKSIIPELHASTHCLPTFADRTLGHDAAQPSTSCLASGWVGGWVGQLERWLGATSHSPRVCSRGQRHSLYMSFRYAGLWWFCPDLVNVAFARLVCVKCSTYDTSLKRGREGVVWSFGCSPQLDIAS